MYAASRLKFVEHFQIYYDGNYLEISPSLITADFFPQSMKKIQKVKFLMRSWSEYPLEKMIQTSSSIEKSYEIEFHKIKFPKY